MFSNFLKNGNASLAVTNGNARLNRKQQPARASSALSDGDCVVLIKDLKLGGGNQVLKGGSKSIRLVDGDHEIDCKVDGISIALKACFVKKA